jgi:hypothetical protein
LHPRIGKRGASAASQRVFPSARTASHASESTTTDTAYHDERFGRGAEIASGRFLACFEAGGGVGFFIGVELPCESAQLCHFNQFSPIQEANHPARPPVSRKIHYRGVQGWDFIDLSLHRFVLMTSPC